MNILVIQARIDSTRLSRKMLLDLGGFKVIEWVIKRCQLSTEVDKIIAAIPASKSNDILERIFEDHKVTVFKGSEKDVLGRVVEAAKPHNPINLIRVCADNPFIDPELIDSLVNFFNNNHLDYAYNNGSVLENKCADGFGAEIVRFEILNKINNYNLSNSFREHVTQFIISNQDDFKIGTPTPEKELAFPELSFDLDSVEDYTLLQNIIQQGISINSSAKSIIKKYLTNKREL